jgi:hypothetical protein
MMGIAEKPPQQLTPYVVKVSTGFRYPGGIPSHHHQARHCQIWLCQRFHIPHHGKRYRFGGDRRPWLNQNATGRTIWEKQTSNSDFARAENTDAKKQ